MGETLQVGCVIKGVDLIAPSVRGVMEHDLGAMVTLMRDWASDSALADYPLATFLIAENLNDVHPLLTRNPRAAQIQVPLPSTSELDDAFRVLSPAYKRVFTPGSSTPVAAALAGSTLSAAEKLFKAKEHAREPLSHKDMVDVRKQIVESDNRGLIEFVESTKTLDTLQGCEPVKAWLRQDIKLWELGDVAALPKGYLDLRSGGHGEKLFGRMPGG